MNTTVAGNRLEHLSLIDMRLQNRLVNRIVKDEDLDHELATRILDQAIGFLRLAASQPKGHYSPSKIVDIGWHTFILYTRSYDEFCRNLTGGRFIHHEPTDDPSAPNNSKGPRATAEAMRQIGLTVDEELWYHVHNSDCSDCTSSDGDGDQGCRCGSCNY